MDLQTFTQLFVAISVVGIGIYYFYKNNEIEKKYADKPNKTK